MYAEFVACAHLDRAQAVGAFRAAPVIQATAQRDLRAKCASAADETKESSVCCCCCCRQQEQQRTDWSENEKKAANHKSSISSSIGYRKRQSAATAIGSFVERPIDGRSWLGSRWPTADKRSLARSRPSDTGPPSSRSHERAPPFRLFSNLLSLWSFWPVGWRVVRGRCDGS